MMNNMKAIGICLGMALFFVVACMPVQSFPAMIDPSFRFSTIETGHFSIHFHQGTEEIADRVASIAEDIHQRVSPALLWTPREKTQIVIVDSSDFANGLTTVLPYNMIFIYPVPPFPDSTIGEYDDWLRMVILHEYAHVLTMDPVRGYSAVMQSIFGKPLPGYDPLSALLFLFAAPPNVFMPGWWHEGMSTWAETEFSNAGRGRSSYYEMIFRMAVLEDRIPRASQLNGELPDWPDGHIAYIYGLLMETYIASKYGRDTLGAISLQQAGRVPFFITGTAREQTGKDYVRLFGDAVEELREEQKKNIDLLRSKPLTDFSVLPLKGELLTNPNLSPDGRYLAVDRRDPHQHADIIILDAKTLDEIRTIRRLPSDHGVAWSPDSTKLYYTEADLRGGFNLWQDIYVYDLEKNSARRITRNARAKDIDVSRDGTEIVFIRVDTDLQGLSVINLETEERKDLVNERGGYALSGPKWSPEGAKVVYSKRDNAGNTSLELFDVRTKEAKTLLRDEHDNIYPTWSPDGKHIVFTSDWTGVYNLFALSPETLEVKQVTHVLGGAFHADIAKSGEKILFSSYQSKGYSISEMPYDSAKWSSRMGPVVRPYWGRGQAAQKDEKPAEPGDGAKEKGERPGDVRESKSYSPFKTLLPKFWLPTLTTDKDGAVFGAFTAGQDVLGYHAYYLQGQVGVGGKAYGDAIYVYDRWYPTFYFRAFSLPVLYDELFNDGDDYWERRDNLTAGIIIPLINYESEYRLVAGYSYERDLNLTSIQGRTVDGLPVFEGRRDHIFAGIEYNGALRYPYSISREEGRTISLLYKDYAKNWGSDLTQREYSARYDEFIGLGKHHVLRLDLRGATADGDLVAQQAFQIGGIGSAVNDYPVRGFEQGFQTGRHVVTGSLEYRFPLLYILRGWGTKPFFWDRLHGAVFVDAGNVWGHRKKFDWDDVSVGVGAEVRFNMVLGYKLAITPAIGVAQGLTEDGETQVYISIYAGL